MPSDPLPLSPEPVTEAGRRFQTLLAGEVNWFIGGSLVTETQAIIAIEQEARTLARTEVIAEAVAAVRDIKVGDVDFIHVSNDPVDYASYQTGAGAGMSAMQSHVLAALSRLGERE